MNEFCALEKTPLCYCGWGRRVVLPALGVTARCCSVAAAQPDLSGQAAQWTASGACGFASTLHSLTLQAPPRSRGQGLSHLPGVHLFLGGSAVIAAF